MTSCGRFFFSFFFATECPCVYIRHLRAEEAMSQLDGLYAVFGGLSTKEGRGCGKSINKQVHVRWMEIGQINIRYN